MQTIESIFRHPFVKGLFAAILIDLHGYAKASLEKNQLQRFDFGLAASRWIIGALSTAFIQE